MTSKKDGGKVSAEENLIDQEFISNVHRDEVSGLVAAIIVTYNRKDNLQNCLQALFEQEGGAPDILIVDNASTDGTKEAISELIETGKVMYYNTGRNIGGAGGFEHGVRKAVDLGYGYLWLMDDDCVPYRDALLELKKAHNDLKGEYGFLSGQVLWTDGEPCRMNIQKIDIVQKIKNFERDRQSIQFASFVSFFVKASVVKRVALPIGEFFIWGDDIEYSRRISRKYPCYYISKSKVTHDCASNTGSDISKDSMHRMRYYFYAYRNEVYIFKREGLPGMAYWLFRLCLHTSRVLFSNDGHRFRRLLPLIKGTFIGLFYSPTIDLA